MRKIFASLFIITILIHSPRAHAKPSRARLAATGTVKLLGFLPFIIVAAKNAIDLPSLDLSEEVEALSSQIENQSHSHLTDAQKTAFAVLLKLGNLCGISYIGSVGAYLAHRGIKDFKKAFRKEPFENSKNKNESLNE